MTLRARLSAVVVALLALVAAGCGSWASDRGDPSVLRLGYFLNVTHAVPIVGLQERFFAEALPGVRIEGKVFKSGPELISAMLSGGIDAAYVGPGPVIIAASRAPRQFRILAGAYDAGALLVARRDSSIRSVRDLDGQRVALPALHNTQDLNLRILIEKRGLRTTLDGGSVNMIQIKNADLANALRTGVVAAALAPEPWATGVVQGGLARVVVPANEVLANGATPTTVLTIREPVARNRPAVVRGLIAANRRAVAFVNREPSASADAVARAIRDDSGASVDVALLRAAMRNGRATDVVNVAAFDALAAVARRAGYLARPVTAAELGLRGATP